LVYPSSHKENVIKPPRELLIPQNWLCCVPFLMNYPESRLLAHTPRR
jgi:hypothetical protein